MAAACGRAGGAARGGRWTGGAGAWRTGRAAARGGGRPGVGRRADRTGESEGERCHACASAQRDCATQTVRASESSVGREPQRATAGGTRRAALLRAAAAAATLALPGSTRLAARAAEAPPDSDLSRTIRLAQREPDPEFALMLWDDAVDLEAASGAGSAVARGGRGLCLLSLGRWGDAEEDLSAAIAAGPGSGSGDERADGVLRAVLYDGRGLARLLQDRAPEARADFGAALGAVSLANAFGADMPDIAPFSGLRGGPPTMGQRAALHAALAAWKEEGPARAAQLLDEVDKGPSPDGQPQFWEARAALTAALFASGDGAGAEGEWAALCEKTQQPPPATPTNPVYAQVNKYAQALVAIEGATTDMRCEDFETGDFLPCDDAGLIGTGGSDAPCVIFTQDEARARLWPAEAVDALAGFRARAPEDSAADRARAALAPR